MSSAGSDSYSSDESSSVAIYDQLQGAVENDAVEDLRRILAQDGKGGRPPALTDDNIHEVLVEAAEQRSVDACRLLWKKLSPRGKSMYFASKTFSRYSILHLAASEGHLELVRLFICEFKMNVNQEDLFDETPLCRAMRDQRYPLQRLEMARFLLEHGANVNHGGGVTGPLWFAVRDGSMEICRLLLLEYQANPNLNRRPADEENQDANQPTHRYPRTTDNAILRGNGDILQLLLEHGAFVGHFGARTSLNVLLGTNESHQIKFYIARLLVEHAKEDQATASFLLATFEFAIQQTDNNNNNNNNDACQILLDVGMDPQTCLDGAVQTQNLLFCQLLVRDYQVDPFLQQVHEDDDSVSPFLAAARQLDTTIFELFLDLWDVQFADNDGKNGDGDYPLHVICCDALVSLQAIKVLVDRQGDVLAMVDGEQGLLPFHFAADWGASLDVIFCLLQNNPDALYHGGNAVSTAALGQSRLSPALTLESTRSDDEFLYHRGPVQKKAKTA